MKIILLLLMIVNLHNLNAQTIEGFQRVSSHTYSYYGKVGKLHELEKEVMSIPEMKIDYEKFNSNRKTQKMLNQIALFNLPIGTACIYTSIKVDIGADFGSNISLFFIGVAGVLSGTGCIIYGNIVSGLKKISAKHRLFKTMGFEFYSNEFEKINNQKLELKSINNGIGLVYSF